MITFQRFSKRFRHVTAVDELTFDVAAGEVVALLGPNGSGKTTSIKAAAGLVRPSAGQVFVGAPARPAFEPAGREACSFLPQHVTFPAALTGHEVLEFHRRLRGCPPARVRDVTALSGLGTAAARAVATYSGGMRQRLGLAVALLPDSPVLLLDEPTAALDADGLRSFQHVVETGRARRQTVLFSSHAMGDVERLADRFVVMANGRLVRSLSMSALADRLADAGMLKIDMAAPAPALLEAVRRIAPATAYAGGQLLVPAPAARRLEALDRVRAAGVDVRGITAQDGRLDALYDELLGGAA